MRIGEISIPCGRRIGISWTIATLSGRVGSGDELAMLLRFIHRILEILLHLERRIEQPFLRPILDAVFREPTAWLLQALINLHRSHESVGLAEETQQLGEDEDVQTMIDEMRRHLVRDFPQGGFERAGNTKTHGLVRGELIVHDGLPENLRRGLFATPKTYGCWVRFSGPGPHIEPDMNDVGFVSISVKAMGVDGEKLWDDEKIYPGFHGGFARRPSSRRT